MGTPARWSVRELWICWLVWLTFIDLHAILLWEVDAPSGLTSVSVGLFCRVWLLGCCLCPSNLKNNMVSVQALRPWRRGHIRNRFQCLGGLPNIYYFDRSWKQWHYDKRSPSLRHARSIFLLHAIGFKRDVASIRSSSLWQKTEHRGGWWNAKTRFVDACEPECAKRKFDQPMRLHALHNSWRPVAGHSTNPWPGINSQLRRQKLWGRQARSQILQGGCVSIASGCQWNLPALQRLTPCGLRHVEALRPSKANGWCGVPAYHRDCRTGWWWAWREGRLSPSFIKTFAKLSRKITLYNALYKLKYSISPSKIHVCSSHIFLLSRNFCQKNKLHFSKFDF